MQFPKCKTGRICDRTEFYKTHSVAYDPNYEAAGCYSCGVMQWRIKEEVMPLPPQSYWSSEEARQNCIRAARENGRKSVKARRLAA